MKMTRLVTIACLFALVSSSVVVDEALLQQREDGSPVKGLIMLPPLNYTRQRQPSDEAVAALVEDLREHARVTQKPIMDLLREHGCDKQSTSLWITNAVTAVLTPACLDALQGSRSNVFAGPITIVSNEPWHVNLEEPALNQMVGDRGQLFNGSRVDQQRRSGAEWNVKWIKSTYLWEKGFRGKGMVHANADTGIEFEHPALFDTYRGQEGKDQVDHNYNWFDATQYYEVPPGDISACDQGVRYPCDDHGHGTHCTGTTIGMAPDHQIGVAPNAQWIGCRNMYNGLGSPGSYLGCLEFFVAPTDLDGKNYDVKRRPHTIGNSYGCPAAEGELTAPSATIDPDLHNN
jgi:hypothetical protein